MLFGGALHVVNNGLQAGLAQSSQCGAAAAELRAVAACPGGVVHDSVVVFHARVAGCVSVGGRGARRREVKLRRGKGMRMEWSGSH